MPSPNTDGNGEGLGCQMVRFYVRSADGSIEGDETIPAAEFTSLDRIEKGFTVLGQRKTMVIEFDPPLRVSSEAPNVQ